ncbi:glycosyltransferase family 2 protein [bacterium]|nr:glycosyltransferase family 2 protein [bacterium]
MELPLVSVIIPHFNGEEILEDCLNSLKNCDYQNLEVLVIDNGSTDQSIQIIEDEFPWVKLHKSPKNIGYSGGCNLGYKISSGKYVVFLNNDTTQEKNWISELVNFAEQNPKAVALQPKLIFIKDKTLFDYSGACGGELDWLGYPFARGRIFFTLEKDSGQYDKPKRIFWASGTACFLKKDVLDEVGLLDEDFFMHFEEIDLCWRINSFGYEVWSVPTSVVFHYSGASLGAESWFKIFLNHRNSVLMLLKNYSAFSLAKVLPIRIFLDFAALVFGLVKFDFERTKGIFRAYKWFFENFSNVLKKRKKLKINNFELPLYKKSIVRKYFLQGKKFYSDLN